MRVGAAVAALAALQPLPGATPSATLGEELTIVSSRLDVRDGKFDGNAAQVLRAAVAQARFVAVGEDHFTNEVPAFVSALCDVMAPQGLAALALEIGPVAAAAITPTLSAPDRIVRMRQFVRRYPNAVAFLDGRADNDAAAHCRSATQKRPLPILGIDQEYIGSAGLVLDQVLVEPMSPAARRAINELRDEERRDASEAARTGNSATLFLTSVLPERLRAADSLLVTGSTTRARQLLAGLSESAAIYALNARGDPLANTRRASLLKRQFAMHVPARGKVLLKFGDWHLYRGLNPLGNFDLGNYVSELAEGKGEQSLHILMLGTRGVHASFAGYARVPDRRPFVMTDDPDYRWLKPAVEHQLPSGWTMFDLRRLRHRRLDGLDANWTRVIAGYDLMILVPELTPSESLSS